MSHSPPICESYPQLNKEQAMYNIIQESISPGLIREPHSPKDTIAILDANVPRTLSQANKFIGALSCLIRENQPHHNENNKIYIVDTFPCDKTSSELPSYAALETNINIYNKYLLNLGYFQVPIGSDIKSVDLGHRGGVFQKYLYFAGTRYCANNTLIAVKEDVHNELNPATMRKYSG
ncbi:unnamed protein product [Rotaria magnacalcarata]|uniref:Uncharacterized protein n=1 Tax=Rotaria magnacalcarata TaxID=392030 RepID=A0A819A1V8_9BILA|nr:unnamed protein product [Rotaria magnacalcarata]CAF3840030.1 unnamed protein product [Rotaria magnacalcarata]